MPPTKEGRIHYLDGIRCLAIIFVVLIHVSAVYLSSPNLSQFSWFVATTYDALARPAVPLFLMISGFLLLSRFANQSLGVFYRKRVSRVVVPLIIWSGIYLVCRVLFNHESFSLVSALRLFVAGDVFYHLRFFYYLIPLYLTVPFLAPLLGDHDDQVRYFLVVWLILTSLVTLVAPLSGWSLGWPSELFTGFLGLFMGGFALGKGLLPKIENLSNRSLALGLLGCLAVTVVGTRLLIRSGVLNETFFGYTTPNIVFLSVVYFLWFKRIDWENLYSRSIFLKNAVGSLSFLSMGIFLIHPLILEVVLKITGPFSALPLTPLVSIPAMAGFILIISWIVVSGLKLLPFSQIFLP